MKCHQNAGYVVVEELHPAGIKVIILFGCVVVGERKYVREKCSIGM